METCHSQAMDMVRLDGHVREQLHHSGYGWADHDESSDIKRRRRESIMLWLNLRIFNDIARLLKILSGNPEMSGIEGKDQSERHGMEDAS